MILNRYIVLRSLFFAILTGFTFSTHGQSPIAGGTWAKFEIRESGMYRVTFQDLSEAGISVENGNLEVYGLPGGTLPQSNDALYPEYLSLLNFGKVDPDGVFGEGDFIYFYAEGPHTLQLSEDGHVYNHNPYAESNYVYIGTGINGEEITARTPVTSTGTLVSRYSDLQYHELTLNNLLSSGRDWFGERFDAVLNRSINFTFPTAIPGGEVRVTSKVMAQAFGTSRFVVQLGGNILGEQSIDRVPDFLNPPTSNPFRYAIKGRQRSDTFIDPSGGTSALTINLAYEQAPGVRSVGYLDYLLVEVESGISLSQGPVIIQARELLSGASTVQVDDVNENIAVWDISDPLFTKGVEDLQISGTVANFNVAGGPGKKFAAFDPESLPRPELVSVNSYSDLLSGSPDLIIVTHPNFASAASRLAAFRQSNDQLAVRVVTVDEIYDLMSSGRPDPTAIRNYCRYFYRRGSLKYLLLMGKGSFDYNAVLPFFSNYVPTYQSRNSLDPLDTYASDDYFGFMEDDEGEWAEVAGGNHTLDIGVGRIPVTLASEADEVVSKIIHYGEARESLGDWRSRLLFVADDEDFNLHHRQSDQLAVLADTTENSFQNKRIFLGAFPQESSGGGETSPLASEALNREIRKGALVVNYTGHGNEASWTQERILTNGMISEWQNIDRLPVFVTATCEFGRYDDPRQISGGERIITEPNGGGIGILTTGRPVFASSNFKLNEAFYNSLFEKTNGEYGRLGDVMRLTKNRSVDLATDANKVGNRNFTLLGDPSLDLAFPREAVEITDLQVNGNSTDTLRAGDRVRIVGQVTPATFTGTVDISVRDKEVSFQTLDAPVYTYQERLNIVYQGKASVSNGVFESEFIVPLNISNQTGFGRIYVYGKENNVLSDGSGAYTDVVIGGRAPGEILDTEGPEIAVYFGDSTNTSRTSINQNTLLYVRLMDESGINTSGFGVGNNITAVLDDSQTYILNEFYKSDVDNFQSGWAVFPINDLIPGEHRVTITARDVFNNSNQLTVLFEVADGGSLIIKTLRNYPNPVRTSTTFTFTHNRPGEDLQIDLRVIDTGGNVITESVIVESNSRSTVSLPIWENIPQLNFLSSGIYIYGVRVRSTRDGATDLKYGKMMVVNEN